MIRRNISSEELFMQRQYPVQELCGEAACDPKCSLRSLMHKEPSQAFYLISDIPLFISLNLLTFFNCYYFVNQVVSDAFLAGI